MIYRNETQNWNIANDMSDLVSVDVHVRLAPHAHKYIAFVNVLGLRKMNISSIWVTVTDPNYLHLTRGALLNLNVPQSLLGFAGKRLLKAIDPFNA